MSDGRSPSGAALDLTKPASASTGSVPSVESTRRSHVFDILNALAYFGNRSVTVMRKRQDGARPDGTEGMTDDHVARDPG